MVDMAQADSTLRQRNDEPRFYYVRRPDGFLYGSLNSHADAIKLAIKHAGQVLTYKQLLGLDK
jgi:hypothetical protein